MGYERLVRDVRKNLIFAIIALALILINLVLFMISDIIFYSSIENDPTGTLVIIRILNAVTLFIFLASLILQFIWVIRSYRLTSKRDPGLQRDSKYGIIFLSMYTGYFLIYPFLIMPLVFGLAFENLNMALNHYINSFFGLTFLFIYLFVFIFPVRRTLTKGQRIALILGAILIMVISIQTSRLNFDDYRVMTYFDTSMRIAGWSTILIVFSLLYGTIGARGTLKGPYETELKKGLKKKGWKRRFTLISDRKPQYLLLFIIVILGAHSTFGYFLDKDEYNKDVWTPIGYLDWDDEYEPPTGTMRYQITDHAIEGEEVVYPFQPEGIPDHIEIILRWVDEPDSLLWENQPETFNLKFEYPKGSGEQTSSNPQGGMGEIVEGVSPNSRMDVNITVTLVDSGNYKRPVGPSFMQRSDGSNEFDLMIVLTYPDSYE